MPRLHKAAMLAGLLAFTVGAAPTVAQLKPSAPNEIAGAVRACVDSTTENGVDLSVLERDGWSAGKMQAEGKDVSTPLRFYSRAGSNAILVLTIESGETSKVCIAVSRIGDVNAYEPTVQAISTDLGSKPFNREGDTMRWRSGRLLIQLETTGTQDKPAVRASVIAVKEEKK